MTETEARSIFESFCDLHGLSKNIAGREAPDGSWLFVERNDGAPQGEYIGVVVRADTGEAFGFYGALGKVFRNSQSALGLPTSNELVLGATSWGRYQTFDHGIATWDGGVFTHRGDGPGNMARPLPESLIELPRQVCVVAFFDLRGFTSWAGKHPEEAQRAIRAFEEAVRVGFPTHGKEWLRLFVKGTGDGVMIVSQADWYHDDGSDAYRASLKPKHAKDFLDACTKTLHVGGEKLAEFSLPVGCAISTGVLDRVFLFGRLDYIGPAANDAAKLQQHARNEVCVTDEFLKALLLDDNDPAKWSSMGWRLRRDPKDGIAAPRPS
jgi:class 3 adenylate cyclase